MAYWGKGKHKDDREHNDRGHNDRSYDRGRFDRFPDRNDRDRNDLKLAGRYAYERSSERERDYYHDEEVEWEGPGGDWDRGFEMGSRAAEADKKRDRGRYDRGRYDSRYAWDRSSEKERDHHSG